jgi:hypothetical protein
MDNAKSFINAGGQAVWKFILFRHNEHQLLDVIKLSKDLGFCGIEYVTCRPGEFNGLEKWPVIINGTVSHLLQPPVDQKNGTEFFNPEARSNRTILHDTKKICPYLSNGLLYITCQNQVLPCCMMHFDTQLNYPGTDRLREMTGGFDNIDLARHSLSTILSSQFYASELEKSFREKNLQVNCARSCRSEIEKNLAKYPT